jgi:hypothetical protein
MHIMVFILAGKGYLLSKEDLAIRAQSFLALDLFQSIEHLNMDLQRVAITASCNLENTSDVVRIQIVDTLSESLVGSQCFRISSTPAFFSFRTDIHLSALSVGLFTSFDFDRFCCGSIGSRCVGSAFSLNYDLFLDSFFFDRRFSGGRLRLGFGTGNNNFGGFAALFLELILVFIFVHIIFFLGVIFFFGGFVARLFACSAHVVALFAGFANRFEERVDGLRRTLVTFFLLFLFLLIRADCRSIIVLINRSNVDFGRIQVDRVVQPVSDAIVLEGIIQLMLSVVLNRIADRNGSRLRSLLVLDGEN